MRWDPLPHLLLCRQRGLDHLLHCGDVPGDHARQSCHIGRLRIREHPAAPPLVVDWRAPVSRAFYQASAHGPPRLRRPPDSQRKDPPRTHRRPDPPAPSRDINLAFPLSLDIGGDEDPVHRRWLEQRNAQGHVLRHNLHALRSSHGIEVHVTFGALPFTPPVQLYLLNGTEALIAYYMITRREEEIPQRWFDALWETITTDLKLS